MCEKIFILRIVILLALVLVLPSVWFFKICELWGECTPSSLLWYPFACESLNFFSPLETLFIFLCSFVFVRLFEAKWQLHTEVYVHNTLFQEKAEKRYLEKHYSSFIYVHRSIIPIYSFLETYKTIKITSNKKPHIIEKKITETLPINLVSSKRGNSLK